MRAYISVSFSKRKSTARELDTIVEVLDAYRIASLIFVDNYQFSAAQEREMMQQAMADIDDCDMLIAETSHKGIGIGIEAGYAKAKGKPVLYLRHKEAGHSTTLSGISDFQIIYRDTEDLKKQLMGILEKITAASG